MRFILPLGVAVSMAACSGKPMSYDCEPGQVVLDGACRVVCTTDGDCVTGSETCVDGICQQCIDCHRTPAITAIDGMGTVDGGEHAFHHLTNRLVLTGENLDGAYVSLTGGEYSNELLERCGEPTAGRIEVLLPAKTIAGVSYTLTVANQAGFCEAGVVILQGERGERGLEGPPGEDRAPTTVVKWGTAVCPSGSTLLYSGWGFGGYYNHTGGGASALCVKGQDPGPVSSTGTSYNDLVYPMSTGGAGRMPPGIPGLKNLRCAVCRVDDGPCFDLWGSQTCPGGTETLWSGYAMGSFYAHVHQTEQQCVEPGGFDTTVSNLNLGGIWYGTEIGWVGEAPAGDYVPRSFLKCAKCCGGATAP
jgi:hypothetical protein